MSDWTAFGRVDADGTVYVKTTEGERVVGSWQAGAPEEGLAHFARRFADLVTEVDLTEARLKSGAADAGHSLSTIRRIRASLPEANVVGDIDALATRLDKLATLAEEKAGEARAARDAARGEALARKTALVEEAEKLAAESTGWKTAGDRLKEILDEWKTIRGVDKKADGELWKRFAAARDGFTRRRGAHFASLDSQRKQAQTAKEELVAEAEKLADSTDWAATANQLKDLMTQWKAAPARLQGGRAEALGTVPGRAGRLLQPAQRGLLRTGQRAARQPGAQAGPARRGRGVGHRRRPEGRPGQAAGDPGPVARGRPGAPRGGRRAGASTARHRRQGP